MVGPVLSAVELPTSDLTAAFWQIARQIKLLTWAVVSCVIMATAVNVVLRTLQPEKFVSSWKLVQAINDPDMNVVFFGTSRVDDGFIPDLFDKTMQKAGIDGLHSYNVAESGESLFETYALAEELFRRKPLGIKFVLIEPDFIGQLLILEPNTMRAINYFTLKHAYRAVEAISFPFHSPNLSQPDWLYARNITGSILRHYFNIGVASANFEGRTPSYSATSHGFPDLNQYEYRTFAPDAYFKTMLHNMQIAEPHPEQISDTQLELVLSLVAYIRARGAIPILVKMPQASHWDVSNNVADKLAKVCAGKGPIFLDFGSPGWYPALWDPNNRQDEDHLNITGARIFTEILARALAKEIKENSILRVSCSG